MSIFVSICAIIACFLFASVLAGDAAQSFCEKKWFIFGINLTLTLCFWLGICLILQMWSGVV